MFKKIIISVWKLKNNNLWALPFWHKPTCFSISSLVKSECQGMVKHSDLKQKKHFCYLDIERAAFQNRQHNRKYKMFSVSRSAFLFPWGPIESCHWNKKCNILVPVSGGDKLCHPERAEVQPGHPNLPSMARQSSGVWSQLCQSRGGRKLLPSHDYSLGRSDE